MQVKVHLVTGDVCTFDLPVDKPTEFLSKIRPTEIFERPAHQFLGKVMTVSINPALIEWVEFDSMDMPTQKSGAKIVLRELSPANFKAGVEKEKQMIVAAMESGVDQNVMLGFGKATFKSGRTLHMEIRVQMERGDDRVKQSQKIFKMPAIFVYGEQSGLMLINTSNVAIWQVVPGLKKSTFFAVPGELVSIQKAK